MIDTLKELFEANRALFTGLNSLEDITLDPVYSAICGYTEADLDTVFAPEGDRAQVPQRQDSFLEHVLPDRPRMVEPLRGSAHRR